MERAEGLIFRSVSFGVLCSLSYTCILMSDMDRYWNIIELLFSGIKSMFSLFQRKRKSVPPLSGLVVVISALHY